MPDANGITLADAQNALAASIAARAELLAGAKSVRISSGGTDRMVTHEDLGQLNKDIIFWDAKIRRLQSGGIRVRGALLI